MSGFSALKALAFPDAFFSLLLGEFLNVNGVDIHGVWVDFGVLVVGMVSLDRVRVIGFLVGDGICPFPLGFKMDGTSVPIVDFGGDSVHAIDLFHEGGRDSS